MEKTAINKYWQNVKIKRVKVFLNNVITGWALPLFTKKRMISEITNYWLIESKQFNAKYTKIINKYAKEIDITQWNSHTYYYKPKVDLENLLHSTDTPANSIFDKEELDTLYQIKKEINFIRLKNKEKLKLYIANKECGVSDYFKKG